jgi:tetratricopeptide (TPR) repeat protein
LTKTKLTDYRGGILDYNKAIELKPKYAEAYNNRAAAKLNLKDNAGAKADANKAITLNPQIAEAYYNRGAAKINLGEINSGCLDLSKAGEMGNTMVYDIIKQYCN